MSTDNIEYIKHIEYITDDGYSKLQEALAEIGVCRTIIPIKGIHYLVYIDDDHLKAFMPYKGNEWVVVAGEKPRIATRFYGDKDTLNIALNNLPQCPHHFFGSHDICSDSFFSSPETDTCAICLCSDNLTRLTPLICGHRFHMKCLNNYALNLKQEAVTDNVEVKCPTCRHLINVLDAKCLKDDLED